MNKKPNMACAVEGCTRWHSHGSTTCFQHNECDGDCHLPCLEHDERGKTTNLASPYSQGVDQGRLMERDRIERIIKGLIGPAVTDVGSLRNEAFDDLLAAIRKGDDA